MNILYVVHQFYPEFHSGTEKFLLNLASTLQKAGHFTQVATYTFAEEKAFEHDRDFLVRQYGYRNIPVVAVRHKTLPGDLNISCHNAQIYQFAQEFMQKQKRCDLVHIAHPMRLASFAEAVLHMRIPYILTLTDFWLICPKIILKTSKGALCTGPQGGNACRESCPELGSELINSRLDFARKLLGGANGVVAPSKFLATIFNSEFPDLPIRIIPHGMDLRYLKPHVKTYRKRERFVFGYCGCLLPHKGVHLLLKAFLDLNFKNSELKLYGSCFHEKEYFRFLKETAGEDARVKFCGTYTEEQVGEVLADIDVLVVPSLWYENYPLVLHEALACSVPVIATNIGGMAEKIVNSVNGFTFNFGDARDLKNKLKLVLNNPEILNGVKEKMREYVSPLIEEEAYMYQRLYENNLPIASKIA